MALLSESVAGWVAKPRAECAAEIVEARQAAKAYAGVKARAAGRDNASDMAYILYVLQARATLHDQYSSTSMQASGDNGACHDMSMLLTNRANKQKNWQTLMVIKQP